MKKIIIIAAVLIFVAVGFFIFSRLTRLGQSQNLKVYKDSGSVSYKPESGEYTPINKETQEIPNHSFVKTESDGLAHILLPDGSLISLAENTEMQVNFDSKETKVLQTLGNAWYRIKKLSGTKEFNVQTPTAVASVRGTIFGVETGQENLVYVTQSSVEISQLVKDGDNFKKENSQLLEENKLSNVGLFENGKPEIIDIPNDKKQTPWFKRNEVINKQFSEGLPRDFVGKLHNNEEVKQIDQELMMLRSKKMNIGNSTNPFGNFSNSNWIQQGEATCGYINSAEYKQAIEQIKGYAGLLGGWYNWLIEAVDLIQSACSDNVITPEEAIKLQNHYQTMPESGFAVPQ